MVEASRPLTARELQILEALCAGLTARQVGEKLGISNRAVSNRRTLIYQKLGARSLAEACRAVRAVGREERPARPISVDRRAVRDGSRIGHHPQLRTFPIHDAEFRTVVQRVADARDAALTPRILEDHLRDVYPSASVRVRRQTRGSTTSELWYVFRAAHVVDPSEDAWWRRDAEAWITLDPQGTFTDISPAAEELLAMPRADTVGRNLFDLPVPLTHEAEEDVRRFWATLRAQGRLRSSIRIPRSDGVIFDLDFYAEANVDAAGSLRAVLRAIRPVAVSR